MTFEVFDKRPTVFSNGGPQVTIQARGVLSLNRAAHVLIGEPEMVELLYDRAEQVVGIRPVSRDVSHGYRIRLQSASKPAGPLLISGTAFLTYYGIDTTTRRWTPTLRDAILCVDLKEPSALVVGNRSKRREAC